MEIASSSQRRVFGKQPNQLESRLSLYTVPPTDAISLGDFEQFSYDRLQVLRTIQRATEAGQKGEELNASIRKCVEQYLPMRSKADQRKDTISHFVLRLAFCRKQDDRSWLCNQEMALFKYRFQMESPKEVDRFMKKHSLDYQQMSTDERSRHSTELQEVFRANRLSQENSKFDSSFFKVPFEQAMSLVMQRRVFVNGGFAFVPREHLIDLLRLQFREQLSLSLAKAFQSFSHVAQDERLAPVVKNLSRQYMGRDYAAASAVGAALTAEQVDAMADRSFPMCMSNLHRGLKRQHHLKHAARLQYGLFLKGIGLSLEEAMRFWRKEFSKKMSVEDFDKQYAYNIRHSYGKEGKRANYTPHSCKKIILGESPAMGQHHGCPFKHWNEQSLRARMSKLRVSSSDTQEIVNKVQSGDFQIACLKHFEATHKGANTGDAGNHPNGWFEASMRHHNPAEEGDNVKTEAAASTVKSFNAPTQDSGSAAPATPVSTGGTGDVTS